MTRRPSVNVWYDAAGNRTPTYHTPQTVVIEDVVCLTDRDSLYIYILSQQPYHKSTTEITHGRWPDDGISGWPNVTLAGEGNVGSPVA